MKKITLLGALFLVFGFLGCGSGSETEVDDPSAGKADDPVARPKGAYELSQASKLGFGDLQRFVVKTDNSFHAEKTEQGGGDLLDGKFTYTKSGTKRLINLKDSAGSVLAKYEFKMDAGVLSLKDARVKSASWFTMAYLESPWCKDAASDCDNQGYSAGDCEGAWACTGGSCSWKCGSTSAFPICDKVGTEDEGWYNPGTGEQYCDATCDGATSRCEGSGRSKGYVTDDGKGCGGGALIKYASCTPAPSGPICDKVGTADEGWYDSATGEQYCGATCEGATSRCAGSGRSKGWVTDDGKGCGGGVLIRYASCS